MIVLQEGVTPLMKAAEMGRSDVVSVLLAAGATPDAVDRVGAAVSGYCCGGAHCVAATVTRTAR
eukprot:XP_001691400.1 predicted protein [Chlamydomonas reinhardtii]